MKCHFFANRIRMTGFHFPSHSVMKQMSRKTKNTTTATYNKSISRFQYRSLKLQFTIIKF